MTIKNFDRGFVVYHEIDGTEHAMYGIECGLCGRGAVTGKVFAEVHSRSFPGISSHAFYCSVCLAEAADACPPDGSQKRLDRVAKESPLVDWISRSQESMEKL